MSTTAPATTSATSDVALSVTRLTPALGAEVRGIDLAGADAATAAQLRRLLTEHLVLFFPDQHLTNDQHVALGRHFGPLEQHPHLTNAFLDHPEIFELAATKGGIADEWHSDLTFLEHPSAMSILNMVRCADAGGDTMWTNLELAYDELSAPLQELCEGLSALHDAEPHGRPERRTIHPVVRTHPETGRKALYVNEHFTRRLVELSAAESDVLLGYLTRWVHEPRFTVRYRWSTGTIAMWDNRCTQHMVLNDVEGERIIQRVTVMGDTVSGPGPRWAPHTAVRGATTRHDRALKAALRERAANG
ncbi:MAG: TauD/TfdA family dioxygenase [Acidimicrobiales bacterium]